MFKTFSILIIILLGFIQPGFAQITVFTDNCKITQDEIQVDIKFTNNSSKPLRWNGAVIRLMLPKSIFPVNASAGKYSCVYIGGSDFPLSFPDGPGKRAAGSTYNARKFLLTLASTSNNAYRNTQCKAPVIPARATRTIGRFSFRISSGKFIKGSTGSLKFNPTTSCVLYEDCKPVVSLFNTEALRKFVETCRLVIP